jgi:hypothetical protein
MYIDVGSRPSDLLPLLLALSQVIEKAKVTLHDKAPWTDKSFGEVRGYVSGSGSGSVSGSGYEREADQGEDLPDRPDSLECARCPLPMRRSLAPGMLNPNLILQAFLTPTIIYVKKIVALHEKVSGLAGEGEG